MERDLELIKKILLIIEKNINPETWVEIKIEGYSKKDISYHIKLLYGAGLIEAEDVSDSEGIDWQATSLTLLGHNFLDAVKNDTKWLKIKKIIKEYGKPIGIEILRETFKYIT